MKDFTEIGKEERKGGRKKEQRQYKTCGHFKDGPRTRLPFGEKWIS